MPNFLKLEPLDEMFHGSKIPPIILNDLPSKTEEDRGYFNDLVQQTFTTDIVSVMPSCDCGETKGEYLVGEICEECKTPVKQMLEHDIRPVLWFRRPANVEKLINPIIWIMLDDRFTKSNYRLMVWLTDRNYNPGLKKPAVIDAMVEAGIPRGYNAFVQNFDAIMAFLFNHPDFKAKKSPMVDMLKLKHPSQDPLQELIHNHRHEIFSDYIPIMNRSMLVLDKAATGIFVENSVIDIRDALNSMHSIDRDYYDKAPIVIENRTAKIITMLTDYYRTLLLKNFDPKKGLPRKHLYGARVNLSFRAVITSHEDITMDDELYIPWCVAMTVLQSHLLNFLMGSQHPYGDMTHNEALKFIYQHVYKYHPMLDEIFQRLISESTDGVLYCVMKRNPSLMAGSTQLLRITKIKTDPDDTTVSMNDMIAM